MKMNLPNKLTLLRVFMIPVFVLLMIMSDSAEAIYVPLRIAALAVFLAASFTDFLDGYIARKYSLITDFGKFMDPLADKLLVDSALILFTAEGSLSSWIVIIIIAREFIISGFRLVASDRGIVIAASWWGKLKTVMQMVLCVILIAPGLSDMIGKKATGLVTAIVLVLTLLSLIDYIMKNLNVITEGSM